MHPACIHTQLIPIDHEELALVEFVTTDTCWCTYSASGLPRVHANSPNTHMQVHMWAIATRMYESKHGLFSGELYKLIFIA